MWFTVGFMFILCNELKIWKDMKRAECLLFICLGKCDQADEGISKSSRRCTPSPFLFYYKQQWVYFLIGILVQYWGKKWLPPRLRCLTLPIQHKTVSCRDTYTHSTLPVPLTLINSAERKSALAGAEGCSAVLHCRHSLIKAQLPGNSSSC